MKRTSIAQLLALALAVVPKPFSDAMAKVRSERNWYPTQHRHHGHAGGHAGQSAKRKARNRKRNKIARASRRANRA